MDATVKYFDAVIVRGCVSYPIIIQVDDYNFVMEEMGIQVFVGGMGSYDWAIKWGNGEHDADYEDIEGEVQVQSQNDMFTKVERFTKGNLLTIIRKSYIKGVRIKQKLILKSQVVLQKGKKYAIKIMPIYQFENEKIFTLRQDELKILRIFLENPHRNVIKLEQVWVYDTTFFLQTQYYELGTLTEYMRRRKLPDIVEIREIFKQILLGLQHIHNMGIIHKDIKLDNIFMTGKNQIVIADFGYSQERANPNQQLCGTPGYLAPEVLNKGVIGEKVDIFSAGIVLYRLLVGVSPLYDRENKQWLAFLHENKDYLKDLEECQNPLAIDLVVKMLETEPSQRPSLEECLSHPFLVADDNKLYGLSLSSSVTYVSTTYIPTDESNSFDLQMYIKRITEDRAQSA